MLFELDASPKLDSPSRNFVIDIYIYIYIYNEIAVKSLPTLPTLQPRKATRAFSQWCARACSLDLGAWLE